MNAAHDGDIATLQYLINDNRIDVNSRGPSDILWVS